jgi:hypothetical protein
MLQNLRRFQRLTWLHAGVMVQKAVLKFVLGKKDVTKLPTKDKSPKSPAVKQN